MATADVQQIAYTDATITELTPIKTLYITEPRANVQHSLTALDKHQGAQGDIAHPVVTSSSAGFAPVSVLSLLDFYDSQLAELANELQDDPYPPYVIVQWNGERSSIPKNWVACDGTNGTPDLRHRFPIGVSSTFKLRQKGGDVNINLDLSTLLLKHRHKYYNSFTYQANRGPFSAYTRFGTITFATKGTCIDTDNYPYYYVEDTEYAGKGSTTGSVSVEYMPAHTTKWYIMKVPVTKAAVTYYNVTVTQPANGRILTNLGSSVRAGKRAMVSVLPNEGYVVTEILVNGAPIVNHTIFHINKDTTISATITKRA